MAGSFLGANAGKCPHSRITATGGSAYGGTAAGTPRLQRYAQHCGQVAAPQARSAAT
ncbi:MAG: hypothetical protein HYV36_00955 [Lentisphaerae bacterium]|nr:hypothetical protein [Lentisphaerota bacterium]